jgi:hypothetical protein
VKKFKDCLFLYQRCQAYFRSDYHDGIFEHNFPINLIFNPSLNFSLLAFVHSQLSIFAQISLLALPDQLIDNGYGTAPIAIDRLHLADKKSQKVFHGFLILDDEVHLPVFQLKGQTVPRVKLKDFQLI